MVSNRFLSVVTKDFDLGPHSVWGENIAGESFHINTLEDLLLDQIKLLNKALLFLFSKRAWIYGFTRCENFQVHSHNETLRINVKRLKGLMKIRKKVDSEQRIEIEVSKSKRRFSCPQSLDTLFPEARARFWPEFLRGIV
jgi:hypothetical protein